MRSLSALFLGFLLAACAADMPVEDSMVDTTYSSPAGATAEADEPQAEVTPESAPTPYGMVIESPQAEGAKGSTDAGNRTAPALAAQRLLTGRWINTTDDEEVVQFTPTHYKTFYQNELLVEEDLNFHGRCPEACSGGKSTGKPCFTISGPAQTDCYGIVNLTDDLLELQLLGISTETVVYRRAD